MLEVTPQKFVRARCRRIIALSNSDDEFFFRKLILRGEGKRH